MDFVFKNITYPKDETAPLYVADVGYHETPPSHTFGPFVRKNFLLHLIEAGKGEIERNGEIVRLKAGEAFLIFPDEITTYRSDEKEPWVYRWISFGGSYAKELLQKTTNLLYMPYKESGLIALKNALDSGFNDTLSYLQTLLDALNAIKTFASVEQPNPFQNALRYLEHSYFLPIDIQTLAMQYGYSRAHFSVAFKAHTGKTPYAYLLTIRLREAKNLLINTQLGVEEIAYSTGFSSVVRFSSTFKSHVGVSPLAYRRNRKNT